MKDGEKKRFISFVSWEDTNNQTRIGKKRFNVCIVLLIIPAIALLAAYGILAFAAEVPKTSQAVLGERGAIMDRNGQFLAIEYSFTEIGIELNKLPKNDSRRIEELADELAPILEMSSAGIQQMIRNAPGNARYAALVKRAGESMSKKIEAAHAEKKLMEISLKTVPGRVYPSNNLASQIIGFVGEEYTGKEGIEFAFESVLAGTAAGEKGSTVVLSIDANVQYILEQIAVRTMNETRAESVMFMAMDPRSGEILGAASLPGFDLNNLGTIREENITFKPLIWAYEPGSVFKIFSLASLLEAGAVTGNSAFYCNGRYEQITGRGERWSITCLSPHGRVGPGEIIIHSCNVGIAQASEYIEQNNFYNLLQDFGFVAKINLVDGLYENSGNLKPVTEWSSRTRATMAIGQEVSVSAIQVLKAASAIANDGIMVSPRFVSRIISANGKAQDYRESGERRQILRPETAQAIRSYMTGVTASIGTGFRAKVDDLSLAVKTGTAQYSQPGTKGYSKDDYITSCIALLPSDSPSLVLYQVIMKPRGETLGGRIAAPAIREAAEALIDYLGIPRGKNPQVTHSGSINIPGIDIPVIGKNVPNLGGYSKRAILPLLLRDDITIEIHGEGWVRRQYPPPGTPVTDGMVIVLELE
ncbi:MAG: transpeptidase family protein [Treponema sp.]|jgi:cell division protein FtsI (penicillin-binding protein 3)|nr:transpeptidase family protein [Treponema sp.]